MTSHLRYSNAKVSDSRTPDPRISSSSTSNVNTLNSSALCSNESIDIKALRQQLRQRRKALTHCQQQTAAQQLCEQLVRLDSFQNAKHIAVYKAFNGEISLQPIIEKARQLGKFCYLPLLPDGLAEPMQFALDVAAKPLLENRYGIKEPDGEASIIAVSELDLVLMPLVGFDIQGTRLGMGGGYYDCTFASRSQHQTLIGVAHQCQQVDYLPRRDWDVPVDMIVTDESVINCLNANSS